MTYSYLAIGLAVAVACTPSPSPVGAESGAPSVASATPSMNPPQQAANPGTRLRAYPPLDMSCGVDADCGLAPTLFIDGSNAVGCCVNCGEYTAGTKAWVAKARSACQAAGPCSLASSCIASTEPDPNGSKCVKSRCVAVVKP